MSEQVSYEKNRDRLCALFLKGVPSEDVALLCMSFEEWFDGRFKNRMIQELNEGESRFSDSLEKAMIVLSRRSVDQKKRYVVRDPWFDELRKLSREHFSLAKRRCLCLIGALFRVERRESEEELKCALSRVHEFNRERAQWLYMEGLLDIQYRRLDDRMSVRLACQIEKLCNEPVCPVCGNRDVATFLYRGGLVKGGRSGPDEATMRRVESGEVILVSVGCCIDPERYRFLCNKCGKPFGGFPFFSRL